MKPYELTVAEQIHLSRLNAKSEPDSLLEAEFFREFAKEKPEILEWAFREHRRNSHFFPGIDEITTLVRRRRRELWEASEAERETREKREDEEKRKAWEASPEGRDTLEKLANTNLHLVKPIPEPDGSARAKLQEQARNLNQKAENAE